MRTLAIETSCDDTSLAVVSMDNQTPQVEHIISHTQLIHQKYGGVVPELASREHSVKILDVYTHLVRETLGLDDNISITSQIYQAFFEMIDCISFTATPGLPGSLLVGKVFAHTLAKLYTKPLIPVHHIRAHVWSLFLERDSNDIQFPLVILTVSGGHNELYVVKDNPFKEYASALSLPKKFTDHYEVKDFGARGEKIGTTLDDAGGECFDKIARMLGGPYPGGPRISQQANHSTKHALPSCPGYTQQKFTRPLIKEDHFDVSFSGVKHQVKRFLDICEANGKTLSAAQKADVAREAQETIVDILSTKLLRAGMKYNAKTLGIVGGVSANQRLKALTTTRAQDQLPKTKVLTPTKILYSTDNAGMIGLTGILTYLIER